MFDMVVSILAVVVYCSLRCPCLAVHLQTLELFRPTSYSNNRKTPILFLCTLTTSVLGEYMHMQTLIRGKYLSRAVMTDRPMDNGQIMMWRKRLAYGSSLLASRRRSLCAPLAQGLEIKARMGRHSTCSNTAGSSGPGPGLGRHGLMGTLCPHVPGFLSVANECSEIWFITVALSRRVYIHRGWNSIRNGNYWETFRLQLCSRPSLSPP